jgi:hypothetical protein
MTGGEAASLTDALLVPKGDAAPSRGAMAWTSGETAARPAGDHRRISFRIDELRHRRLKLASVHLRVSAQSLVLAAVEHYLDRIVPSLLGSHCPCVAPDEAQVGSAAIVPLRTP